MEGAKTFTVMLSTPSGRHAGATTTATVTINDNDAFGTLQFASAAYTVNEGSLASLVVTRTGGNAGAVTVQYGRPTVAAAATPRPAADVDYTTNVGVLTFANGVVSQTIMVPTKADTLPRRTRDVHGHALGAGWRRGPGHTGGRGGDDRRRRDAAAAVRRRDLHGGGGHRRRHDHRAALGPATTQNTVQYALAGVSAIGGGVDFDSTGGTLTFAPGVPSRTIVVAITKDTINEPAETFTVTLRSMPSAARCSAR